MTKNDNDLLMIEPALEPAAVGRRSMVDLYAATLSFLCLLHCLALPMLTTLLPVLGHFSEHEGVHRALVVLAAPAALWVGYHALPVRRAPVFFACASVGLGLLVIGAFLVSTERQEVVATTIGALLLGYAHLWHWTRNRRENSSSHLSVAHPGNQSP